MVAPAGDVGPVGLTLAPYRNTRGTSDRGCPTAEFGRRITGTSAQKRGSGTSTIVGSVDAVSASSSSPRLRAIEWRHP